MKDKLDEVIEKLVELKTSSMTQREKPEIKGQHLLMLFFCFFDFVCLRGFSSFFVLSRICTDNLSINTAIKEKKLSWGPENFKNKSLACSKFVNQLSRVSS